MRHLWAFMYICLDATRIIMNDHKFFINIYETFVGIYVLGRAKRQSRAAPQAKEGYGFNIISM